MLDRDSFLERALVDGGLVDGPRLERVRRHAAEEGVDLVDALVALDVVAARDLAILRADICESAFVDLDHYEPNFANTSLIPRAITERYCVYPLFVIDGAMTLAMDDPLNIEAADHVRQVARCEVDAVLAERGKIRALIQKAYSLGHGSAEDEQVRMEVEEQDDSELQPIVAAVNQVLHDAVQMRASDVHLSPDEQAMHLRYRIDGVLHPQQAPSLSMHSSIVQRLKVMAQLDLTQTRRPQDGKFRFRFGSSHVDVRMSTMPTIHGENVVLRLLANTQTFADFLELGVPPAIAHEVEHALTEPYGILLVTGPTGSGKTTTLYTGLSRINDPSRNLMTIEDPVEIRLPYVRQIQVHPEIGLTFAAALRSILRQDPDVVLVGEIRDEETATIAMQAALTGHLVLSTLHTNDAVGAVARLRDYGMPPFVLNSAMLGALAQRLVRRVCSHCAHEEHPSELARQRFSLEQSMGSFRAGRGCNRCAQTGYRGRVGIYEYLRMSPAVRRLIEESAPIDRLREVAVSEGMRLMWQDGLDKARLGQTTLEEVTRAASIVEVGVAHEVRPEPQERKSA